MPSDSVFSLRLRCLLAVGLGLHGGLGALLGLSVDEAHYALYALHPALSYFDHPPLVGWVQWPLVALHAPVAVLRLVPGVVWLATVVLACRLSAQLATPYQASDGVLPQHAGRTAPSTGLPNAHLGQRAAWWTAVALLLAPLLHVLGIGLLPDSLLMLLAVAIMAHTHRLMQPAALQSTSAWLGLGVLLGLAGLAKYTAVFWAVAVAACLLAAHGVGLLRHVRVWLAAAVALLLVLPVLVWNAQHGWVSFAYQAQHGAGGHWQGLQLARFLAVQVVAFGALLWWGWAGWRRVCASSAKGVAALGSFFVVPFGVLAAMSGGGSSLPHWTAPAWVCLSPLAGVGLAHAWQTRARWVVALIAGVQALCCTALLGLMCSGGQPLLPVSTDDAVTQPSYTSNPFADLHGWDAAGERARALAAQRGLASVSVQNWTLASRLGWYAQPLPVHVLEDRFTQFSLWAEDLPVGANTLLVDWSQMPFDPPLGAHGFARCESVDALDVVRLGHGIAQFRFWACYGWSGQPAPVLKTVVAHD